MVEKTAPPLIPSSSIGDGSGGLLRYQPTKAQREDWLLNCLDRDVVVYHLPVYLTIAAGISADTVRAVLIDVAARHQAQRTVYPDDAGEPVVNVRSVGEAAATAPITSSTLEAVGIERAVAQPVDLTVDAPWRAVLDASGEAVELVLVAHHMAIDEWSLPIVLAAFAVAVRAQEAGHESTWPAATVAFNADLEARTETSGSGIYWRHQMRRAPEHLALSAPASSGSVGLTCGHAVYLRPSISSDLRGRAVDVARSANTTVNTVLSLALAPTLGDHTDTDDIVLSMPFARRETRDELHTVGMFVLTALRITGARVVDAYGNGWKSKNSYALITVIRPSEASLRTLSCLRTRLA